MKIGKNDNTLADIGNNLLVENVFEMSSLYETYINCVTICTASFHHVLRLTCLFIYRGYETHASIFCDAINLSGFWSCNYHCKRIHVIVSFVCGSSIFDWIFGSYGFLSFGLYFVIYFGRFLWNDDWLRDRLGKYKEVKS